MYFQEFCDRIANPDVIEITHNEELPVQYEEPLNILVNLVRPKIRRAETIKITFVQNKFDDMSVVYDTLDNVNNGDVHDSLATVLSKKLYDMDFNNLHIKEMAIIKVLAIYLMLQSANNNE